MEYKDKVQIEDATIYLGDCMEILPTLPKVDAVITDPPYGIDFKHKNLGGIVGDASPADVSPFLLMGVPLIIWGGNHFSDQLPRQSRWLMWLKHDPCMFDKRDHGSFDLAWTNLGGSVRAFKSIWDGSIRQGDEFGEKSMHPTQKPASLMRWCVEMVDGTVLDPFMGSGTTGIACAQLGRKFKGIEIEPKYFDIACRRIENAYRQKLLIPNHMRSKDYEQVSMFDSKQGTT